MSAEDAKQVAGAEPAEVTAKGAKAPEEGADAPQEGAEAAAEGAETAEGDAKAAEEGDEAAEEGAEAAEEEGAEAAEEDDDAPEKDPEEEELKELGIVEQQDLEKLPDLDMEKCGLPSADAIFAQGEEALDTTTHVNNGIVKSIEEFLHKVKTQPLEFGPKEEEPEPEGALAKIKAFVSFFIRICKDMLSDITACLPQIDLGQIKEGKLSIVWPTFSFEKLSDELRPKAEKAWEWVKSMATEIKDLICHGFAKVPEITKNFLDGCKALSFSKLLGEAKANCKGISDATKKGKAVQANIVQAKNNIVKFVKTVVSNASQPLVALLSGFREALKDIQQKTFAAIPAVKGKSFPSFGKAQADKLDANGSMTELPRLSTTEIGIKEVDDVFSGVRSLFDTLVDTNNDIIKQAKTVPGAESGDGLKDAIAMATFNAQDAMEPKKGFLCCGGGYEMPKVDASWDKLKKGDIKVQLPPMNMDKLPDSAKAAAEKLVELSQKAIDLIKNSFKTVAVKFKELLAAIKKLTPKRVKELAKKTLDNVGEIPHKAMMCADNVKIFYDLMTKTIAYFFATFTSIMKAIKEGVVHGIEAIKKKVAPIISKAPAVTEGEVKTA